MVYARRQAAPDVTVPLSNGVPARPGGSPNFLDRLAAAERRDALASPPPAGRPTTAQSMMAQNRPLSTAAAYRERYAQPPDDIAWHKASASHASYGRHDPATQPYAQRVGPSRQGRSQFGPLPSQISLAHPHSPEGKSQGDLRPNEIRPDRAGYARRGGVPEDKPAGGRGNLAGPSHMSGVRKSL